MNRNHPDATTSEKFLSCLYGSELGLRAGAANVAFLSCLYGSELSRRHARRKRTFLSCLYGSEPMTRFGGFSLFFLSCLYGSELNLFVAIMVLIKKNINEMIKYPFIAT